MNLTSIIATILLGVGLPALAQSSGESRCANGTHGSNVGNVQAGDACLLKKPESKVPEPPVLVDATGKVVGLYVPSARTVILRLQDATIAASVTNQLDVNTPYTSLGEQSGSTYRWAIQEQTWFLSSDCSGPPIPLAAGGLRPVAYTQDKRTGALTAYIGGTGISTPKRANSARQPTLGLGPLSGQCSQQAPFGGAIQGFDVEQTVVLSQRFREPLTVR